MNKALTYSLLAALVMTSAGCSKDGKEPEVATPQPIVFRPSIDDALPGDLQSSAATRAVAADLGATSILLNGYYSNGSLTTTDFAANAKPLFSKLEVSGDGSYSGSRYFWAPSLNSRYHFWGYNNIGTIEEDGQQCGVIADSPDNGGAITFVQPNDPQKMYDLVLAKPVWDRAVNDGIVQDVELLFQHALAKINFRIYNPNMTQLNDCGLYITFAENTFKRKATFQLYAERGKPTIDDKLFHSGTHLLAPASDMPSTATTVNKAWFLGDMIMLPQNMPYGSITLKLKYFIDGTADEREVEAPIPPGTFEAGKSYTYSLLLDAKAATLKVVSVQLLPWKLIYSDDIKIFEY